VTAAGRGIGFGVARELAAEGVHVAICSRTSDELEAAHGVPAEYDSQVLAVPTDMRDESQIAAFVKQVIERFGGIGILMNNAGFVGSLDRFEALSTTDWRDLFELNFFSVVAITRMVIPYMREQKWGRVINISSENGTQP
jgi:NAD(P)-dependent dehydrogenase (short-subunit alcohol dehydrogenase family)